MTSLARLKSIVICLAALSAGPGAIAGTQVAPEVQAAEANRIAAINKALPSVVAIFANGGQGGGSGVIISPDGYALTNFHVAKPAGVGMKCGLPDGKLYDAVIVGVDPTGDVALVKLLGRDNFPVAELGDSDRVVAGEGCFTMGNPFLLATDFQPSVAFGVVSGTHRYQYPSGTILEYADCIQVDAAINPGNSGGPLFNAEGQLIGINGRGSFEKRGRVNVGVGYAISINQIKKFLGALKSGRIVDHATAGATVASSEDGRVVVSDILESSDAFRRGLRYDDEIVSFASRPIRSVNQFKNVLGTLPKNWRVPLSYRREGKRYDIWIRLTGVHHDAELLAKAIGVDPGEPGPLPQKEKGKIPLPDQPKQPHGPRGASNKLFSKAKLPEIVQRHFEERTGFCNYYFNRLNQQRLAQALVAQGDFSGLKGPWTLIGTSQNGQMEIRLTDNEATATLPTGVSKIKLPDDITTLAPPQSGGLLATLHLWRKLLVGGPAKFGQMTYLGTAPLVGHDGLVDVLSGVVDGVECRFYFDTSAGVLVAMEMYPDDETDPCEVYWSDYKEDQGRLLPRRMEVRYGDNIFGDFRFTRFDMDTLAAAAATAPKAKEPQGSAGSSTKNAPKLPASGK